MVPTCFLFRDASAIGKIDNEDGADQEKPIPNNPIEGLYKKLLIALEDNKIRNKEFGPDGKPFRFISERRKDPVACRPYTPLHGLRVSLITALARGGMRLDLLMGLAGHTRLVMTIYYRQFDNEELSEEVQRAQENLVRRADELTISSLKSRAYEDLPKSVVADEEGLRVGLPRNPNDRNAAGWERQLGGWCIMGGNTSSPTAEENMATGGCFNGGAKLDGNNSRQSRFASVRPKCCMEGKCRWFVSRPEYILEIRAKIRLLLENLHSAQRQLAEAEDKLMALKREKIRAEREGKPFIHHPEYVRSDQVRAKLSAQVDELLTGIGNCSDLADRVTSIAMIDEKGPAAQLVAQGTAEDLKWAIEPVSDLLALSGICLDAEVYPELVHDAETAILRRSQLIDAKLLESGEHALLTRLNVSEQLHVGNRLLRELGLPLDGRLKTAVAMIEGGSVPAVSAALLNAAGKIAEVAKPLKQLLET